MYSDALVRYWVGICSFVFVGTAASVAADRQHALAERDDNQLLVLAVERERDE